MLAGEESSAGDKPSDVDIGTLNEHLDDSKGQQMLSIPSLSDSHIYPIGQENNVEIMNLYPNSQISQNSEHNIKKKPLQKQSFFKYTNKYSDKRYTKDKDIYKNKSDKYHYHAKHNRRYRSRSRSANRYRRSSSSSDDRYSSYRRHRHRSSSSSSRYSNPNSSKYDYQYSRKKYKKSERVNSDFENCKLDRGNSDNEKSKESYKNDYYTNIRKKYRRTRYSRSYSRSRSRDRYRRHSRRYSRSKSRSNSHDGKYSNKDDSDQKYYSEASHDESSDDIDGISMDEVPPSSWYARRMGYGSNTYSKELQPQPPPPPLFKNDGSFLEMFKKMQESQNKEQSTSEQVSAETKKPNSTFIGKRRGGRVLKTGVVMKAKSIEEQSAEEAPKDAWSIYMQEVRKYKEAKCDEEVKTRPLVK